MSATSLSVGTMNFGKRTPEPEARRIVERALAAGIVDFDTANSYENGESERILGIALKGHSAARIATKVGLMRLQGKPEGLSPERVIASARASRDRLGRETIDLLYLHAPDPAVPVDETLSAVRSLMDEKTISQFGVSNHSSWRILEMIGICRDQGMPPPVDSQVIYNVLVRQIEIEYLSFAAKYELKTTVYNPLAGGLLTGRYRGEAAPPKGSRLEVNRLYRNRYGSERMIAFAAGLEEIAKSDGLTIVELAYLWLFNRPGVDRVLLGPATVAHLDAALAAREKSSSPEATRKVAALQLAFDGTDAVYAR